MDEAEELRRVIPVIEALAGEVRLSIDTVKPAVARAAVAAGATLVNDVSATLGPVAGELGVGYVVMHRRGDPPHHADRSALRRRGRRGEGLPGRARRSRRRAPASTEIWVDPGIGFGKTTDHNLSLLRHLDEIVALGYPVLVGTSRKGFLGRLLAASDGVADPVSTDDRLEASLATATWAMAQGAAMIRVHDVRASLQAAKVVAA